MQIPVVGYDPSLRHWGIAEGSYDLVLKTLTIQSTSTIEPILPTSKQTRVSSKDILSAQQLFSHAYEIGKTKAAVFIEVPSGTQNVRGAIGNGVCFGVIGALKALDIPVFELTAKEIKGVCTNDINASKKTMIEWAISTYPEAPFDTRSIKGDTVINVSKAEHQCDAVGAIHTGIQSHEFQSIIQVTKHFR